MNLKLLSTAILAIPVMGFAQDAFDKHCSNVRLLQDKGLQQELKISAAQRTKMNASAATYTKTVEAIVKGKTAPNEADQKRLMAAAQKMKDGVVAVLSAAQLKRLREVSLQFLDARAVADDKVAKRIGLSAAQLTKYRKILQESFTKAEAAQRSVIEPIAKKYRAKKPKDKAEAEKLSAQFRQEVAAASKKIEPRLEALSKSASTQLRAVLSSKQLASFEALKGKPYRK